MTNWYFEAITEGKFAPFGIGDELRADLKGKVDWIGINYYSRLVVKADKRLPGYRVLPGYGFACKPASKSEAGFPTSDSGWEIYPQGLRKAVNMIKKYGKPIMVTENGIADASDRQIVVHCLPPLPAPEGDKGGRRRRARLPALEPDRQPRVGFRL
jgi:beta-galactosidase